MALEDALDNGSLRRVKEESCPVSLNIVIPVYNEGANIAATLGRIAECMQGTAVPAQVTIVYDFDGDDTLPVVESVRAGYAMPIRLQKNTGKGVCDAIKQGLLASQSSYVLVTMADMSDDYAKLPLMLEKAASGWDIVCGSRYMRGGRQYGGPFLKKTLSRMAGLSLYWLAGVPTHDVTNSYKLYRRSILDVIPLESSGGFEIGIEIVVKAHSRGMRITEVPCSWWDRTQGESRFRLKKWIPLYLKWYRYALKNRWAAG
ncbi:MAG: glycosyltransferase [Acidobacteriaceae bacterium]